MNYQVSRNGQMYGPYTLEDLQRYVTSGNVLLTDMAKTDDMPDWLPVSQILAPVSAALPADQGFSSPGFSSPGFANSNVDPLYATPVANAGALAASPYPEAPNLHWALVLLFSFLTCGIFMFIWNLIIAAWLKRVQPNSKALFLYLGAYGLVLVYWVVAGVVMMQVLAHRTDGIGSVAGVGPFVAPRMLIAGAIFVLRLLARFNERTSLQEHFNTVEPVGLSLNPVMTFFFGGLYIQSELNRINAMKQAARAGGGRGL